MLELAALELAVIGTHAEVEVRLLDSEKVSTLVADVLSVLRDGPAEGNNSTARAASAAMAADVAETEKVDPAKVNIALDDLRNDRLLARRAVELARPLVLHNVGAVLSSEIGGTLLNVSVVWVGHLCCDIEGKKLVRNWRRASIDFIEKTLVLRRIATVRASFQRTNARMSPKTWSSSQSTYDYM